MRLELIVRLANGEEHHVHAEHPMPLAEARAWLDQEFVRLECVPSRASGKVLTADKLLSVAQAVDAQGFGDAAWATQFLRAAAGALDKHLVKIDLESGSVGY